MEVSEVRAGEDAGTEMMKRRNMLKMLAGGAMLARDGSPLLLTSTGVLPAPTAAYLASAKTSVKSAQLFGGSAVLSAAIMNVTMADLN